MSNPQWNKCFKLLLDPAVSEIEANGPQEFFMKKNGKREALSQIGFSSHEEYVKSIEEGLIPHVRTFNKWDPLGYIFEGPLEIHTETARIKGRTHIILPPASDSPQVTIAKKSFSLITLDAIAGNGTMSLEMKRFIEAAMNIQLCTVFSGATGSGKTTMLEAVAKLIPGTRRIGVAEDTPELELTQPNVSYLHSVPWAPGMDPNKVATLDWCVAQFNRMRTDMLIVGETRGKEFASFLTAANSGMEGCLTTIHANTPTRCLDKMTNFALKGSDGQSTRSVNSDIGNAIDLIVQLIILPNGRHKVSAIQEITAIVGQGDDAKLTTNPLYVYDHNRDKFKKSNYPTDALRQRFEGSGVNIKSLTGSIGEFQEPYFAPTQNQSSAAAAGHAAGRRIGGLPTDPRREV